MIRKLEIDTPVRVITTPNVTSQNQRVDTTIHRALLAAGAGSLFGKDRETGLRWKLSPHPELGWDFPYLMIWGPEEP